MLTEKQDKEPSNDNKQPAAIVWPSLAWRAEWLRQATPATTQGALAYAEMRLAGLDGLTCGVAAGDLVHDALLATHSGEVRWRPERVSLVAHLCDQVGVRLKRMRRDAMRVVQLDHMHLAANDNDGDELDHRLVAHRPEVERGVDMRRALQSLVAALWRRAAGDQAVLAVLNAVAEGADDDQTVAEITGLSRANVRAARARLRRMVAALPVALQEQTRSLLS